MSLEYSSSNILFFNPILKYQCTPDIFESRIQCLGILELVINCNNIVCLKCPSDNNCIRVICLFHDDMRDRELEKSERKAFFQSSVVFVRPVTFLADLAVTINAQRFILLLTVVTSFLIRA
jgi:hypothetical protein